MAWEIKKLIRGESTFYAKLREFEVSQRVDKEHCTKALDMLMNKGVVLPNFKPFIGQARRLLNSNLQHCKTAVYQEERHIQAVTAKEFERALAAEFGADVSHLGQEEYQAYYELLEAIQTAVEQPPQDFSDLYALINKQYEQCKNSDINSSAQFQETLNRLLQRSQAYISRHRKLQKKMASCRRRLERAENKLFELVNGDYYGEALRRNGYNDLLKSVVWLEGLMGEIVNSVYEYHQKNRSLHDEFSNYQYLINEWLPYMRQQLANDNSQLLEGLEKATEKLFQQVSAYVDFLDTNAAEYELKEAQSAQCDDLNCQLTAFLKEVKTFKVESEQIHNKIAYVDKLYSEFVKLQERCDCWFQRVDSRMDYESVSYYEHVKQFFESCFIPKMAGLRNQLDQSLPEDDREFILPDGYDSNVTNYNQLLKELITIMGRYYYFYTEENDHGESVLKYTPFSKRNVSQCKRAKSSLRTVFISYIRGETSKHSIRDAFHSKLFGMIDLDRYINDLPEYYTSCLPNNIVNRAQYLNQFAKYRNQLSRQSKVAQSKLHQIVAQRQERLKVLTRFNRAQDLKKESLRLSQQDVLTITDTSIQNSLFAKLYQLVQPIYNLKNKFPNGCFNSKYSLDHAYTSYDYDWQDGVVNDNELANNVVGYQVRAVLLFIVDVKELKNKLEDDASKAHVVNKHCNTLALCDDLLQHLDGRFNIFDVSLALRIVEKASSKRLFKEPDTYRSYKSLVATMASLLNKGCSDQLTNEQKQWLLTIQQKQPDRDWKQLRSMSNFFNHEQLQVINLFGIDHLHVNPKLVQQSTWASLQKAYAWRVYVRLKSIANEFMNTHSINSSLKRFPDLVVASGDGQSLVIRRFEDWQQQFNEFCKLQIHVDNIARQNEKASRNIFGLRAYGFRNKIIAELKELGFNFIKNQSGKIKLDQNFLPMSDNIEARPSELFLPSSVYCKNPVLPLKKLGHMRLFSDSVSIKRATGGELDYTTRSHIISQDVRQQSFESLFEREANGLGGQVIYVRELLIAEYYSRHPGEPERCTIDAGRDDSCDRQLNFDEARLAMLQQESLSNGDRGCSPLLILDDDQSVDLNTYLPSTEQTGYTLTASKYQWVMVKDLSVDEVIIHSLVSQAFYQSDIDHEFQEQVVEQIMSKLNHDLDAKRALFLKHYAGVGSSERMLQQKWYYTFHKEQVDQLVDQAKVDVIKMYGYLPLQDKPITQNNCEVDPERRRVHQSIDEAFDEMPEAQVGGDALTKSFREAKALYKRYVIKPKGCWAAIKRCIKSQQRPYHNVKDKGEVEGLEDFTRLIFGYLGKQWDNNSLRFLALKSLANTLYNDCSNQNLYKSYVDGGETNQQALYKAKLTANDQHMPAVVFANYLKSFVTSCAGLATTQNMDVISGRMVKNLQTSNSGVEGEQEFNYELKQLMRMQQDLIDTIVNSVFLHLLNQGKQGELSKKTEKVSAKVAQASKIFGALERIIQKGELQETNMRYILVSLNNLVNPQKAQAKPAPVDRLGKERGSTKGQDSSEAYEGGSQDVVELVEHLGHCNSGWFSSKPTDKPCSNKTIRQMMSDVRQLDDGDLQNLMSETPSVKAS